MTWTRHKALIAATAVAVLAALVTGALLMLRGGEQAKLASAARLRSPFTGEPVGSLNRVLAVKIDNVVYGRPQTGLTHADIVYVLPVEGGDAPVAALRDTETLKARPGGDVMTTQIITQTEMRVLPDAPNTKTSPTAIKNGVVRAIERRFRRGRPLTGGRIGTEGVRS